MLFYATVTPWHSKRKNKNTGEIFSLRCLTDLPFAAWFVVNPLKSIRAQQNGADEHKHGAHHEHIKLQGKVHDCDSLVRVRPEEVTSVARCRNAARRYDASQPQSFVMHSPNDVAETLDRSVKNIFIN